MEMMDSPYNQPMDNQPQFKLAQAYVPYQKYRELYNCNEALYRGTIFKELFRPYSGKLYPYQK